MNIQQAEQIVPANLSLESTQVLPPSPCNSSEPLHHRTVSDIPLANRILPITGIILFLALVLAIFDLLRKRCFTWKNSFVTAVFMFDEEEAETQDESEYYLSINEITSRPNGRILHSINCNDMAQNSASTEITILQDLSEVAHMQNQRSSMRSNDSKRTVNRDFKTTVLQQNGSVKNTSQSPQKKRRDHLHG